jgi:hypothetical protein
MAYYFERGAISIDSTSLRYFTDKINIFRSLYSDVHFCISQVSTKEMKREQAKQKSPLCCYSASYLKQNTAVFLNN